MPYWIGVDLSVERANVCILDKAGTVVAAWDCEADATEICRRLKTFRRTSIKSICIEAGFGTHIVRELRAERYPVQVVEVARAGRFLRINRIKTDASDARGLAELVRVGQIIRLGVHVKSLDAQNIRTLLVLRRGLIRNRLRIEQMIQSIVRSYGGKMRMISLSGSLARQLETAYSKLAADGLMSSFEIEPLVQIVEAMRHYQRALDRRASEIARSHPVCRLLMSVPGVGPITALSFFSAIDDPTRFRRASDIGPYLGLIPTLYQSGATLRQGRISKAGSSMTRSHLFSAAVVMLNRTRADFPLRTWGRLLRQRIGARKAHVAVARKLAVLMLAMWKSGRVFDASYGAEAKLTI